MSNTKKHTPEFYFDDCSVFGPNFHWECDSETDAENLAKMLNGFTVSLLAERDSLKADNDRMREALEKIAYCAFTLGVCQKVATAALNPTPISDDTK